MGATCRRVRMICTHFASHAGGGAISGGLIGEMFAGANDGETLVIEKALDLENSFDVLAAIKAVAAGALHGLKRRKLRFPVAQDESLRRGQAAYFSDAEETFVRNR